MESEQLAKVKYAVGDTVKYVCRSRDVFPKEGDICEVIDIREGILDTAYATVKSPSGRTATLYHYCFKKVDDEKVHDGAGSGS